MLTSQWQKAGRKRGRYIFLMCAGTWLLLFLGPLSIGIWLIYLVALAAAVRWRSWQPLLIPLLSPLAVGFLFGTAAWFQRHPEFEAMGLPNTEFFNLDRATRCYWTTGGCKVYGSEWMLDDSHNLGLKIMTTLLGPPHGTYHGPYPTEEQALKAVREVQVTPLKMFQEGDVLAGTNQYHLGTKFVENFLLDFNILPGYVEDDDELRQVQASVYEKQCLIIRVAMKNVPTVDESLSKPEGIVLVDLANMKPFALYVPSGHVSRIPRVLTR